MKNNGKKSIAFGISLTVLMIFAFTNVYASTTLADCAQTHQVQRGETLTAIASRYGTTVQKLLELNPIIRNPDLISTGTALCVQPTLHPPGPEMEPLVALSLDYKMPKDDHITFVTRAGSLGTRQTYPLVSSGVERFDNGAALLAGLGDQPVIFFGVQQDDGYALLDPTTPVSQLSGCPVALSASLAISGVLPSNARLTVEGSGGADFGFPIVIPAEQPFSNNQDRCETEMPAFALAVSGTTPGRYRFLLAEQPGEPEEQAEPDTALSTTYTNRFVIESSFALSESATSRAFPSQTTHRLVFDLPSVSDTITGVQPFSDISDLRATITEPNAPMPLFLGVRLGDDGPYQLVVLADRSLLTALGGSEESVNGLDDLCVPQPASAALSGPGVTLTHLTAYLETASGSRLPFPVADVSYAADASATFSCNPNTAFVLRPSPQGTGYQLEIILTEDGFGPPGEFRAQNCGRWRGGAGWRYWLLRRVFGCR